MQVVCFSELVFQTFSSCATTAKLYTYMYAADGISGSVSVSDYSGYRRVQCRTPATAVQLLLHVQDSAESACSVRTGYVFFGTLVVVVL